MEWHCTYAAPIVCGLATDIAQDLTLGLDQLLQVIFIFFEAHAYSFARIDLLKRFLVNGACPISFSLYNTTCRMESRLLSFLSELGYSSRPLISWVLLMLRIILAHLDRQDVMEGVEVSWGFEQHLSTSQHSRYMSYAVTMARDFPMIGSRVPILPGTVGNVAVLDEVINGVDVTVRFKIK